MADWNVQPSWKKSVIERNYMRKDGEVVMVETGWRWGEFIVTTDDDNPPKIEAGVDMFNCGYESEMVETFDGCWEEVDYDDVSDETQAWLEEFFEEGNSYYDLEEHGWDFGDCEMIIDCDLVIRKINEDGSLGDPVEVDMDSEETVTEESPKTLNTKAAWPFPTAQDEEYAKFKCLSCDFSTEDIMDLIDNPYDDDKGPYICPKCEGKVEL